MSTHRTPLALCIAALLLAACSSGGGSRPAALAPAGAGSTPPPSPPAFNPCPAPIAADCVVAVPNAEDRTLPPAQSGHALVLNGPGELRLDGAYRFDGGTRVSAGQLRIASASTLESDVRVEAPAHLFVAGRVEGDVTNLGTVQLWERVQGDLDNSGLLLVSGAVYGNTPRIGGDFQQDADGVFEFALAPPGWDSSTPLQVDGRASLDGTLRLARHDDGWGPYPLPGAGSHAILHADGGVSGTFAEWTASGMFIEGAVRYGERDVWFDLVRASASATMQAGPASALVLASAGNLDAALGGADGFAGTPPPTLTLAQRQFLASATALLWTPDRLQATRSLESLAGHAHVAMLDALQSQLAGGARALDAGLAELAYSPQPVAWSMGVRGAAPGATSAGTLGGSAQWLGPRLLVGAMVGTQQASMHFDAGGGRAAGEAPLAGFHAHYRGEGWHAGAQLAAGRADLRLQRELQIGARGHVVHAQRMVDHLSAHAEAGRTVEALGGTLVPFAAFDYLHLRGDGFAEMGDSGFELVGDAAEDTRLAATLGTRYARQWSTTGRALRLHVEASHRFDLLDGGQQRAAFRGVPDVHFDLPRDGTTAATELRLRLDGALGAGWRWSADYGCGFAGRSWSDGRLVLQRAF